MGHASVAGVTADIRRPGRLLRLASDERLVALVRRGDEGAFEALYDRHHRPILGFCRHMLGTREEAEDAVQHTFLAAFRDIAGSTKPIDLRPWLFAIARNRCLSLLRARREQVALELAQPTSDSVGATVERREDVRELLGDIALLPEDQRAALLLAELGALDHAGIASVLGCPRERVKALVFQARSSLAASREARATPCEQIRVELATASGATLRRGPLRRHLRACEGCRVFKDEVAAQRKLLALALPVVPGVALKASVLGAVGVHGGASGVGAGAVGAGTGVTASAASGAGGATLSGTLGGVAGTGAAKVAISLVAVGAVVGGSAITVNHHRATRTRAHPPASLSVPSALSAPTRRAAPAPGRSTPQHAPRRQGPAAAVESPVPAATAPHGAATATPQAGEPTPKHAPAVVPSDAHPAPHPAQPGAGPQPSSPPGRSGNPPAPEAPPAEPPSATGTPPSGGTPPGNSGNAPGQSGTAPGNSANAPGHGGTAPGNSANAPGHTGAAPGNSANAPGHTGAAPGNSANAPGHTGAAPGNSANAPGHTGAAPGNSGNAAGQPGTPPGNSAHGNDTGPPASNPGESGHGHGSSSAHGAAG
jgi:RNA polymerase sigma factor (sigma-70 family)